MRRRSNFRGLACITAMAGLLMTAVANAHPHMWIDARFVAEINAAHQITAVRQVWRFDEMFGAYATQGLKKNNDGSLSSAVRERMARDWMSALGEPISHYFTRVSAGSQSALFLTPREEKVDWVPKAGPLSLSFMLPLKEPMSIGPEGVHIDVYDPTYFIAYAFDEKGAVSLNGPGSTDCHAVYRKPKPLDWKTMQQLAAIPAEQTDLPEELFAMTKGLTHRIEVSCP